MMTYSSPCTRSSNCHDYAPPALTEPPPNTLATFVAELEFVRRSGDATRAATALSKTNALLTQAGDDQYDFAAFSQGVLVDLMRSLFGQFSVERLDVDGTLHEWTLNIAALWWIRRGRPLDEGGRNQHADYAQAQVELAYIYAERLLASHRAPNGVKCPVALLTEDGRACPKRVEILKRATVHDYVKRQAYYRWTRERQTRGRQESLHLNDYLAALDDLKQTMTTISENCNCSTDRGFGGLSELLGSSDDSVWSWDTPHQATLAHCLVACCKFAAASHERTSGTIHRGRTHAQETRAQTK